MVAGATVPERPLVADVTLVGGIGVAVWFVGFTLAAVAEDVFVVVVGSSVVVVGSSVVVVGASVVVVGSSVVPVEPAVSVADVVMEPALVVADVVVEPIVVGTPAAVVGPAVVVCAVGGAEVLREEAVTHCKPNSAVHYQR
jgi:hypothetical protein